MAERLHRGWIRRFHAYGKRELAARLREMGVRSGDTVMAHSAFSGSSGFTGKPGDVVDALLEVVGPKGHLMMVSLPYTDSTIDYLERGVPFDVRRTPSRMGIISEFFRRRPDVVRSLHPTHPILVWGADAEEIIRPHAQTPFPCGPESPFQAGVDRDGVLVFFDTQLNTMTFFHWLEHELRERLPFPLYHEPPFEAVLLDREGMRRTLRTYAFSREAIRRRRDYILHEELERRGVVARGKVGNSRILLCRMREVAACATAMADRGEFFFELD